VPADRPSRPAGKRRHRSRRRHEPKASPDLTTYGAIQTSPEPHTAWRLLRNDWLDGGSAWEERVEDRQAAPHRLARSHTHLSDAEIVRLLLKDREASVIATHFGRPFVVPGALESFLHEVHGVRRAQRAALERLDAYAELLVGQAVESSRPATSRCRRCPP